MNSSLDSKATSSLRESRQFDQDAPHPECLQVIKENAPGGIDKPSRANLSTLAWSVSEIGPETPGNAGPVNSEASSVGPWESVSKEREMAEAAEALQRTLDPTTARWRAEQHNQPVATFLHDGTRGPNSDECDIDPTDGTLLSPIVQPSTHKTVTPGDCRDIRDISWRHDNMNAMIWIARELKKRAELREKVQMELAQVDPNNSSQKEKEHVFSEDAWPTADCLLRPATKDDFAGIAAVVEAEKEQEYPQVFGTAATHRQSIQQTYNACKRDYRPFIVAVSSQDAFLDRSKWPKGADKVFEEYVRFAKTQKPSNTGTILGFGFVSDARAGLFGTVCPGSRFAGRITVLVHPDHRKQLYGSALLDRILLSTAVYHRSVVDYKWECPDPALIYEHPVIKNQRKYARLHIEGLFASNGKNTEVWVDKMLEKFEFKKVGRLGQTARTGSDGRRVWMDSVIWELEARPITDLLDDEPQRRICMD